MLDKNLKYIENILRKNNVPLYIFQINHNCSALQCPSFVHRTEWRDRDILRNHKTDTLSFFHIIVQPIYTERLKNSAAETNEIIFVHFLWSSFPAFLIIYPSFLFDTL